MLRQLWVYVAVVFVIAVQAHGVISTRHQIEHAAQSPVIDAVEARSATYNHDHADEADPSGFEAADASNDMAVSDGGPDDQRQPVHHHHHGGGEVQMALFQSGHPLNTTSVTTSRVAPGLDRSPPLADLPDFLDPPRTTRLIA